MTYAVTDIDGRYLGKVWRERSGGWTAVDPDDTVITEDSPISRDTAAGLLIARAKGETS